MEPGQITSTQCLDLHPVTLSVPPPGPPSHGHTTGFGKALPFPLSPGSLLASVLSWAQLTPRPDLPQYPGPASPQPAECSSFKNITTSGCQHVVRVPKPPPALTSEATCPLALAGPPLLCVQQSVKFKGAASAAGKARTPPSLPLSPLRVPYLL